MKSSRRPPNKGLVDMSFQLLMVRARVLDAGQPSSRRTSRVKASHFSRTRVDQIPGHRVGEPLLTCIRSHMPRTMCRCGHFGYKSIQAGSHTRTCVMSLELARLHHSESSRISTLADDALPLLTYRDDPCAPRARTQHFIAQVSPYPDRSGIAVLCSC